MEFRDIRPGRELDADQRGLGRFLVVLGQFSPDFRGLDPDHCIVGSVVVDPAAEHFGADHALAQAIEPPRQRVFHDQLEKVLSSFTARERLAREHILEMIAHQTEPFRTELLRIRDWIGRRHTANPCVSDSNTANVAPKPTNGLLGTCVSA